MWKVLFGFSSSCCLIVIAFILMKMAREVILLSRATLPKGRGGGDSKLGGTSKFTGYFSVRPPPKMVSVCICVVLMCNSPQSKIGPDV